MPFQSLTDFKNTVVNGETDSFVARFNEDGSGLTYSTLLYGESSDIALDSAGNAYVVGSAYPEDDFTGGHDAFVLKKDPSQVGSEWLIYSTYIGGGLDDQGNAIAVDASGNAYITGWTLSTDFPITPGAFQTTLAGSSDIFISKINALGSALLYSTYLGGNNSEQGTGIAVDSVSNAYITGGSDSTDFPTVGDDPGSGNGYNRGIISELDMTGSALTYSNHIDIHPGMDIAVDFLEMLMYLRAIAFITLARSHHPRHHRVSINNVTIVEGDFGVI